MAARGEELEEGLADLVRGRAHRAIVAQPTIDSPRSSTAVWPGAAPQTGSCERQLARRRSVHGDRRRCGSAAWRCSTSPCGRCRRRSVSAHAAVRSARARADGDGVRGDVGRRHVERLAASPPDAEAAALADGEGVRAAVAADRAPGAVDQRARAARARPPWRARNASRPVPARKQRSCESGLRATARPSRSASSRTCGFVELAEREAHPRDGSPGRARRACSSGPWRGSAADAQQPVGADARVVAGRERAPRRAARRGRASRRGARARCSARTGSASGRRRDRRATARRRPRGTRRAGRASGAAGPCRGRARGRRARRSPSSTSARRRSPPSATARA